MPEALVITPVKDSIETTLSTIQAINASHGVFTYEIYNDFSTPENTKILQENQQHYNYRLINLQDITSTPSPNYRLVLKLAQQKALEMDVPLIIVESDVDVKEDTLHDLVHYSKQLAKCGMVAAITTDTEGNINFPYLNFRNEKKKIVDTKHSLSFCCTLLTTELLCQYDFAELSGEKHWYDVYISRKSVQLGLHNYLITEPGVIHKPHSSRPWKQLKYTNPLKYYFQKFTKRLDRI
jgi:hypothetical protein